MLDILSGLGAFGTVNMILAFVVVIVSLKCAIELFVKKKKENLERLEIRINSILFFSGLIVVLGFLGTFLDAFSMMTSINAAHAYQAEVIFGGITEIFKLIIVSLSFFTVSFIVWYILWTKYRKLLRNTVLT